MKYNKETGRLSFDVDEVLFISTENKSIPFAIKGKPLNVKQIKSWEQFMTVMKAVSDHKLLDTKDWSEKPLPKNHLDYYSKFKVIIIDSYTRAFMYHYQEFLRSRRVTGYEFWGEFSKESERFLMNWNPALPHQFYVFTSHDELVKNSDGVVRRSIKTDGKRLEGMIESYFATVLFTEFDASKKSYCFLTNTDGKNSAKSPFGMFDEIEIPNDLGLVLGTMYDYYDMENDKEYKPSPLMVCGQSGTGKTTSAMFLFDELVQLFESKKKAKIKKNN